MGWGGPRREWHLERQKKGRALQIEGTAVQRLGGGNWKPGSVTGGQRGMKRIEDVTLKGWVGRSHHKECGLLCQTKSLWGVLVRALTAFREQSAWGPDTAWCGRRCVRSKPEPASPVGNHHAKVRSVTIMQPYIKCTLPAPTPRLVVKHNDCSSLHAIQDHC